MSKGKDIEKIKIFRDHELKPLSKDAEIQEIKEIEHHLISANNLKECYIAIEKVSIVQSNKIGYT